MIRCDRPATTSSEEGAPGASRGLAQTASVTPPGSTGDEASALQ
jgi:hypothetical protein